MNKDKTFDYIIVGAGAAGCVLADALSKDPSVSVCLLEAGGRDWSPILHIPAGKVYALGNPKYDWRHQTQPDPSRRGKTEVWPRGKVLGGSTSINGLFYVRGNPADFDDWAASGNDGWSYEDVTCPR
jgi:choline dehydrogenase